MIDCISLHIYGTISINFIRQPIPTLKDLPSGKRLHNELENHHVIAGQLSTISMGHFLCR